MDERTKKLCDVLGCVNMPYPVEVNRGEDDIDLSHIWYEGAPVCAEPLFDPYHDLNQAAELANLYCEPRDVIWSLRRTVADKAVRFYASFVDIGPDHLDFEITGSHWADTEAEALTGALLAAQKEISDETTHSEDVVAGDPV